MNLSYSDYLFMVDIWLKYKKRHNIHIKWKREISDRERLNRLKKRRKYRGKPVNHPVVLAVMRNLNMRDATVMVNPKLLCGSRDVGTLRILFRDARKKGDEHNAYSNMIKSTKCN